MPLEAPRSAFVCDEESRPRTREERQVFLRHAGLSRERLEVAPYDACVVKPSLACQPLKPFAIVEPQPRRHRLGRGGRGDTVRVHPTTSRIGETDDGPHSDQSTRRTPW